MLRNDKERRAYIEDSDNWTEVDEALANGKHCSFRIVRLKGTPIVRVLGLIEIAWIGRRWHELGTYELDPEAGTLRSVYSLSVPQVAQRLRELGI